MTTSKAIAQQIKTTCEQLGWTYQVRGGAIFTITKRIEPNSNEAFRHADSEYYGILDLLPRTRAGSDWGTDGGGVGALAAMQTGIFKMNRSGGRKGVLTALAKL